MAGHQEDQEQQLAEIEQLSPEWAQKELTSVAHTMHLGIPQLELAHDVPSVPRYGGKTENNEKCPGRWSALFPHCRRATVPYGTIPRTATADGRDRIPSEMFSATITA